MLKQCDKGHNRVSLRPFNSSMAQRIHRPLAQGVIENLMAIFNENKMADKVVETSLKGNKKWGSRDRNFVADNTYGVVRWWRLLKFCAEVNERKIKEESYYWQLLGAWLIINEYELPEWEEFNALDAGKIKENYSKAQSIRKVRESIPDWLDEIGEKEVPEWEKEIHALNQSSDVFLRVNTLKTTMDNLLENLDENDVEVEQVPNVKHALRMVKRKKLSHLSMYRKGHFEVQDPGSQIIANFTQAKADMKVIDACAGAGGKSLALSALMKNQGQIIAMDVEKNKLAELERRSQRNGVRIIETKVLQNEIIQKLEGYADRLLLDVPCSGTGVLKRNPDAKWKLKPEFLEKIKATQEKILQEYSSMVAEGGKLIYATCSLLQSENEDQVENFLKNNPEFTKEAELRISPVESGFDGFYMARLVKSVPE